MRGGSDLTWRSAACARETLTHWHVNFKKPSCVVGDGCRLMVCDPHPTRA